jgi:hypothetical protein
MQQVLERRDRGDAPGAFDGVMDGVRELLVWYDTLDPIWKLLFTLPFIVAAAGLASEWWRTRRANR